MDKPQEKVTTNNNKHTPTTTTTKTYNKTKQNTHDAVKLDLVDDRSVV
jgi:hypothetical protein